MYIKTASDTWLNTGFIVLLGRGTTSVDATKFAVKATLSTDVPVGISPVELKGTYTTEADAIAAAERIAQGLDPSIYAPSA
ncbi:hypothetical protein ADL27_50005 [Streptomyces sp. NRRL F-6602]|nr:hypothetical protein ADL27_50005 [Streptomyces sp. NRRL F-6602]